jgi:hypothetical protein
MTLKNRWIVRAIDPFDYLAPEGATHCVECRAVNMVAFYGTRAECIARCAVLNSGSLKGVAR